MTFLTEEKTTVIVNEGFYWKRHVSIKDHVSVITWFKGRTPKEFKPCPVESVKMETIYYNAIHEKDFKF
jgi:hypothetical protein